MPVDDRDVLTVLRFELEFLESGGYACLLRMPWRGQLVFRGSPSCINYSNKDAPKPCSDCVLIQLVPPERQAEKIPCLHIPLNAKGDTVESFYRAGKLTELEDALRRWLRTTIRRLEREGEASELGTHQRQTEETFDQGAESTG